MRKFGRFLFVLFAFIPVLVIDGWDKTLADAKEFVRNGAQ